MGFARDKQCTRRTHRTEKSNYLGVQQRSRCVGYDKNRFSSRNQFLASFVTFSFIVQAKESSGPSSAFEASGSRSTQQGEQMSHEKGGEKKRNLSQKKSKTMRSFSVFFSRERNLRILPNTRKKRGK
jgi:hypothetical protein